MQFHKCTFFLMSSIIAIRHCSVHNATITIELHISGDYYGYARLYYNPDERRLSGRFTLEKCKKSCYENAYCDLALWFSEGAECHVYRFRSKRSNESEILKSCKPFGADSLPANALFGHYHGYNLCPLEKATTISCTSYQGKSSINERY